MSYNYSVCYPNNPEVDHKGVISKDNIIGVFTDYPWDNQLNLVDRIGAEKVDYFPSMAFKHGSDNISIELTAFRDSNSREVRFTNYLIRYFEKPLFFGLFGKKEASEVHYADFTIAETLATIEQFLNNQYFEIEQRIKNAS